MSPVPAHEFERMIAGLSREESISFVADLWEARGREVRVEGPDISVRGPDSAADSEVYVVHSGSTEPPNARVGDREIDVLVSNTDSAKLRAAAERVDARFVGPAALRGMAMYAIDRDSGDRLFQRYFDRSIQGTGGREWTLERAATGPRNRARSAHHRPRDREDVSVEPTTVGPRSGDDTGTIARFVDDHSLVLLAVVVGMIVIGGVGWFGPAFELVDDGPGGSGGDVPGGSADPYPPGLGPDGISNVSVLAGEHADTVSERPYSLVIVHRGSRGLVSTNFRWIESYQRLNVTDAHRFTYRVNGTLPPMTVGDSPTPVAFVESANGSRCRHRTVLPTAERVQGDRACLISTAFDGRRRFAGITEAYLLRYLDTPGSEVRHDGERAPARYRVIATGSPARINAETGDYRAVATVADSGAVLDLRVEYTLVAIDGPERVRFEFRFSDAGEIRTRRPVPTDGTVRSRRGSRG